MVLVTCGSGLVGDDMHSIAEHVQLKHVGVKKMSTTPKR